MGLWDNSRQIEARIFKIRQKLSEQDPTLIPYFENDAYPAAVVGFKFWIEFWYCETILVKMLCELLKSVQNKGTALFLCTQCYVHKIQRCPFIFGRILTILPPF